MKVIEENVVVRQDKMEERLREYLRGAKFIQDKR